MYKRLFVIACMAMIESASVAFAADGGDVVRITYAGNKVAVENRLKGVKVVANGSDVVVDNALTDREVEFVLSGTASDGSFAYKGNYKSTIVLNGLNLKSSTGSAIDLKCGKRMKVKIADGTENALADASDTLHNACLHTKGHLEISGGGLLRIEANGKNAIKAKEYIQIKSSTGRIVITSSTANAINSEASLTIEGGTIDIDISGRDRNALTSDSVMTLKNCKITANVKGDGGKGIKADGDLIVDGAEINIATSGNYLSEGGGPGFGGPPMEFGGGPGFGGPPMDFGGGPGFGGPPMEFGGGPGFGGPPMEFGGGPGFGGHPMEQPNDSIIKLLFADEEREERGEMMGPMGKRFYQGAAKAMKSLGKIVVKEGSKVNLQTQTGGAEGMEGKRGVTIEGGEIYIKSHDDAINSAGKIMFTGGNVFVWSTNNDAIDSNHRGEGAITITGGTVISCSQPGPPEEAFDCDFSPMLLTGGTVFGMGGSMGGQATSPRKSSDTQPTAVVNLPLPKGKTLVCQDKQGKTLFEFSIPFSMRNSNSILSLPAFSAGETYTIKIKESDVVIATFTL